VSGDSPVTVTDDPQARRYEARVAGSLAGVLAYMRTPDLIALVHTEVDEAYEGQGVGSALARAALDEAREQSTRVVVICPFVERWLTRHPEYCDLRYEPASKVTD
jgi:predicted GNAT family acetyltransferase